MVDGSGQSGDFLVERVVQEESAFFSNLEKKVKVGKAGVWRLKLADDVRTPKHSTAQHSTA